MPRAAGNRNHYTFVLKNMDTGRYRTDVRIDLPSVTHIIGSTLAKPQLVPWAYAQTRDVFVSLAKMLREGQLEIHDYLETFEDEEDAEEYLKANRLRPTDVAQDAADRGTEAHGLLERLAEAALEDEARAQRMAERALTAEPETEADRWNAAIAGWWLDTNPHVEASETVLVSTRYGYAGSVDLVWWDNDGNLVVTDLKSRKEKQGSYSSDHIQVCAYAVAWNERNEKHIDRKTVLVARPDGTWVEDDVTVDDSVWLDLLSVYKGLRA